MAHIRAEKVRGFWIEGELVCHNCILPVEMEDLGTDDLFTSDEMDEADYYFCDRGNERILK